VESTYATQFQTLSDKERILTANSRSLAERSFLKGSFKESSYWVDDLLPPLVLPEDPLKSVDVAIVGSGYTGLNAAIETARGGRSTLALDAENPGWGCSTRNGGQVSTSIKPSLENLTARVGEQRARAIRKEGETALSWIEERILQEAIHCDFNRSGRFHAAHTPKHYEYLSRDADKLSKFENIESYTVSKDNQRQELGTDAYFGGVVFPRHASLDPAKYHRGLMESAINSGAHITGNCAVQKIEKQPDGFVLSTIKGTVKARNVIVATNGYTSGLTAWQQRRVIPIGSYVIATEPLPTDLMDTLFPKNRSVSDTCKVVYYYRPSPDRKRIIFGGRVSASETDPSISAPILYADMCRIFPELRGYKISHSWSGNVAYTFDELAHIGCNDGIHYAMGYCGSGVSMASYLGMRLGQKVLGKAEGKTAFDELPFSTRPFYRGTPWFLPAAVAWYRWRDKMQCERAMNAT
jgi:glycine/D-amino acid oxidase-like deaminating enzyme